MQPLIPKALSELISIVTDTVSSPHSKRAYGASVVDFYSWWARNGGGPLTKQKVLSWRLDLERRGLSAATVSLRLAAIRRLACELADNRYIDTADAAAIERVKSPQKHGSRLGNWLSDEEAAALIQAPDENTVLGLRDKAVLILILGAGVRRAEIGRLRVDNLRKLEGRWVLTDITGKGNRVRSIPIAEEVAGALKGYWEAAGIGEGYAVRRHAPSGAVLDTPLGSQGVYHVWHRYAPDKTAPHDGRRTFAQAARRNGADIEQISYTLGHASIKTTERYLGGKQNLTDSPGDRVTYLRPQSPTTEDRSE